MYLVSCVCFTFRISIESSSNIYANPLGGAKEFKAFKNACHIDLQCTSQHFPFMAYEHLSAFASLCLCSTKNQPLEMRLVEIHEIGIAFVKWTFGKMQMSLCVSTEYCALSLPHFI